MALEHINITPNDPEGFIKRLMDIFDWNIRWRGAAIHGGESLHVGDNESYIAIYIPPKSTEIDDPVRFKPVRLNYIGITVDDLEAAEARVKAAGLRPKQHADYEPGRRFYYDDPSGIEIEVVSYAEKR